jgi:(2Fe-2S) ferredoxin
MARTRQQRLGNIASHILAGGRPTEHARTASEPAAAVPVDPSKFRENKDIWMKGGTAAGDVCALTAEQVATYNERGWVTPLQFRVAPDVVERIKDDHERFVHRYLDSHPEFADYCGAILNYDLAFLEYCRDPDILNMVSQCIGPDIALWNSSFFAKPPETGRRVPW